jgi:DNA repair photolyase
VFDPNVFPIDCKSVLTKSRISSLDYALNPYLGCEHGCIYCYAIFMAKFRNVPGEWGSFVGVKKDAPAVLAKEVARRKPGVVCLGTVCDGYQPVEEGYRISRACLEAFLGTEGFDVGVLTKSDLVLRDADILESLESSNVGITVTCLDAGVARAFEPRAPSPARRLDAIRELRDRGIPAWGFFGPILPTFSDSYDAIAEVLTAMDGARANYVLVDQLNPYPRVWSKLRAFLQREFPDRLDTFAAIRREQAAYEVELRSRVLEAANWVGIDVELCF